MLETKPEETKKEHPIKETPEAADLVFFNVMPKNSSTNDMIDPKIVSVDTEAPTMAKRSFKEIILTYKLYFILGMLVIIVLPAGYFLINYFGAQSYKEEDLLMLHDVVPKPKPTNLAQAEGFTTPKEWRDKYFENCSEATLCGDAADADHDGLSNVQEFNLTTDPNNPDSDQDGLSDGDEVNIFTSSPLDSKTAKNQKFTDLDYVKGGFSFKDDSKLDAPSIRGIGAKMESFGLHQPTLASLENILNTLYNFSNTSIATTTNATTTPKLEPMPANIDQSLSAKQDRDTKRSNTIKNIEIALIKYQIDNKKFPDVAGFTEMFSLIKPYLKVATNPIDPINSDPYLYSYAAQDAGKNFTLTFYSEVAAGPISKHADDAQKDANMQSAETYDNQRQIDMEDLRTALLLYSQANIAGNQTYVFPAVDKYKTVLVPDFISAIPKDPMTGKDYEYQPSATFDAFTLKVTLQNPPSGNTGYFCNQEDICRYY